MSKIIVKVGMSSCGIAAGAGPVYEKLETLVKGREDVELKKVGCIGLCFHEPLVEIEQDGKSSVYGEMTPEKAETLLAERTSLTPVLSQIQDAPENHMMGKQVRIVLRNCGLIDPQKIEEYEQRGGYASLRKSLLELSQDQVIDEVLKSGLRGRGGAGFPTGMKWRFAHDAKGDSKYVVCNADEGDPGAFMDRSVLEGDPHSIIEGMAICGYAIGASQGIIYCRAEYPLAIKHINKALEQAREKGYLGQKILGTGFSFDIYIKEGAGAFVCGEETALMKSIEGKRGEPRPRPPFPAESGLWDCPTLINNVETYANVAAIIRNGAEWFAGIGTEKSKGTEVFALAGKITNTGLIEVPMGTALRTIVEEMGGGAPDGGTIKAVQTGGPSGGCIPAESLDTPVDYESLGKLGSIMGSGGMIVMDQTTNMVEIARFFMEFCMDESCGKCVPCRAGTAQMHALLTKIVEKRATARDLQQLEELCEMVKNTSLCGLGQTAPNPTLSTLRFFRKEYESLLQPDPANGAHKASAATQST